MKLRPTNILAIALSVIALVAMVAGVPAHVHSRNEGGYVYDVPAADLSSYGKDDVPPYPLAPLCTVHDPDADHGLWNKTVGCHFDHHHGGDPDNLNDKFGTRLFDRMGSKITSPWHTFTPEGVAENVAKHEGSYWITLEDLPCTPSNRLTNVRAAVHQHAEIDFMVRYHSLSMEASGCDGQGGTWYAQLGGWHDRGDALVNGVPVAGGDVVNDGNLEAQHRSNAGTQVWYTCLHAELVLNHCIARASLSLHDAWDPTSASNPTQTGDYFCYPAPNCRANATVLRSHLLLVEVIEELAAVVDADGDGRANWDGYANRWGTPVTGCTAISLDCVPMTFVNVPVNTVLKCDTVCAQIFTDYDIYFCNGVVCGANSPGAKPSGWQQPHH